ncbi:hypothetical protein SO802_010201 [Lithocarpus litseifolius]|uniref:Protein FAR1-RELATED SEQUENCE n=1 Tax=Lithocarpus litseifolius TaxID=425828 RepID=A0AAW2DES6_9ROSI
MVQEELLNEQKFLVLYYIDKEGYRTYTLSQYASPDSRWEVVYCQDDQSMKCSCLLFESYGYPCGHLFAIMKVEHLKQIPPSCIMNKWLKTAKSDLPCKLESQMSPDIIRMARFSALSASCSQMCYFGSRTTQGFEELKVEIARLTRRMEELYNSSKEAAKDGIRTASNKANLNVRDPAIVKTKGDHGSTSNNHSRAKVRRCSSCNNVGHTRRTCPSTHIQQGEHVDGDNTPESMEHPADAENPSNDRGFAFVDPGLCFCYLQTFDLPVVLGYVTSQEILLMLDIAKVSAYATHGVFPKRSWERFTHKDESSEKAFSYFWKTDSCPLTVKAIANKAPFEVLSLAGSIADGLQI